MNEAAVTRGEFDMLRASLSEVTQRLNNVDSGSNSVAAMAVQVQELAKDMGEMKQDVSTRFEAHQKQHADDLQARRTARRWMVGTVIGAAGAVATVILMLLDVIQHLPR